MKPPEDLQTLQQLADYLEACIALEGKEPWPKIAYWIMDTMCTNAHADEWDDELVYPDLREIIDIVWKMEIPEIYGGLRESDCTRLKQLVHQFAKNVESQKPTS